MITINRADHVMVLIREPEHVDNEEWVEFDIDTDDWQAIIDAAIASDNFAIVTINGIRYLRSTQ